MRHSRKTLTGLVALLAVLLPASAAFGYTSSKYLDVKLPNSYVASGPVHSSIIGAAMVINSSPVYGAGVSYTHVDTRANSGLKFQAESIGTGASMSHVPVSSGWNRCWWVAEGGGSGSRPTVCYSRIP